MTMARQFIIAGKMPVPRDYGADMTPELEALATFCRDVDAAYAKPPPPARVDTTRFVTVRGVGGLLWAALPPPDDDSEPIPIAPVLPGPDRLATAKRRAATAIRAVIARD